MVPIFEARIQLRHIGYSNFANNTKNKALKCSRKCEVAQPKKRQQRYSEVCEQLSVMGAQRKVFYEVWRVAISRLSVLEGSQHLG